MSTQMNRTASLLYRRSATQHATVVGLVIALHDTLIGDLQRAAAAMEQDDIETRCNELIHGFQVLTQLDAMVDMNNGGEAAVKIRRFYSHIRGQMLTAQFKLDPQMLYAQVDAILTVREAWEQVDTTGSATRPGARAGYPVGASNMAMMAEADGAGSFSCSG
jgi:flagellar protein FliS